MINLKQIIIIGVIFLFAVTTHGKEIRTIKATGNTKVSNKILKSYTDNFGGGGPGSKYWKEYATPQYKATTEIEVGRTTVTVRTIIYSDKEGKEEFGADACRQILSIIYERDPDFEALESVVIEGLNNSLLTSCRKLKRR